MTGMYELEWHSHFDNYIRSAKIFVDVGTVADGYYSLRACKKNENIKVIALEPLKLEFEYLLQNITLNKALKRVTLLKVALGEENTETVINGERVPMFALDSVKKLNLPQIDIIKIDVEGLGLSVIKGAIETIKNSKPVIFLEIHNKLEEKTLNLLKVEGYNVIKTRGKIVGIPNKRNRCARVCDELFTVKTFAI